MRQSWRWALVLTIAVAASMLPKRAAQAATYTVDTTADELDGSCTDGDCSLRDAIVTANRRSGSDTIEFDIGGCGGACTIQPALPLPPLTDHAGVLIDGYSQPGAAFATSTRAAVLRIELDGSLLPDDRLSIGINITSSSNTVSGLAINRFPWSGIRIGKEVPADQPALNVISGNHIGTDLSGTVDLGNRLYGVLLSGAFQNRIGGSTPAQRNVVSGNDHHGVVIAGEYGNTVAGNYIGVDASGNAALANDNTGVWVWDEAYGNTVGGDTVGHRNIIAGNTQANVRISDAGTVENDVIGNFIGTNASGEKAIGSSRAGVEVSLGASRNHVGLAEHGNLISGHVQFGVLIDGETTQENYVRGNWIGLNADGDRALPNARTGIEIRAASNFVGGVLPTERNVISGNGWGGIRISGVSAAGNEVFGNYIGTDPEGGAPVPNEQHGVMIRSGAHGNTIGGDEPGQGNLISANRWSGVEVAANDNVISGNLIGLDAAGAAALGNQWYGVSIRQEASNIASNNQIGPGNQIAHNLLGGVYVIGDTSDGNTITRNGIFSNGGQGIHLDMGANNDIAAPAITNVTLEPDAATGTACAFCRVELFTSSQPDGQGEIFLADTIADADGNFSLVRSPDPDSDPPPLHPYFTATATDANGTSEFSAVFVVPPPAGCPGDCNGDDRVTVDELVTGVNIALGTAAVSACLALDVDGSDAVTIDELIQAVDALLSGCGGRS